MDERSDQAIANKARSKQVRKERGASGANYTKNQYQGDILKHRVGSVGISQNKPAAAKQHILTTRDQKHSGVYRENVEQFIEDNLPMVKLADIMADYGLVEASKPDFLDADKDGNKKEPMKKAFKDAKKKPEGDKDQKKTEENIEEHITTTSANAVQQALSELRKLAGV